MGKTILMIGAFDTKGPEYSFIREQLLARGHDVLAMNFGVMGTTELFPVEVEADAVAAAGSSDLATLRKQADRGVAMKVMAEGAPRVVARLYEEKRFDGIIGMGGTGGSSVITAAMRALPIGVPKLCVSTAASGDTSGFVGTKDVVMFPSIVDVAGLNRISKKVFSRAAGAIAGMVEQDEPVAEGERPVIGATMFGNTTECVSNCTRLLEAAGYEVLVFHATGTGGRTLEALVDDGLIDAVLDITTTELADLIAGGIFDSGPDRLSAPGRKGIPHLIAPGCVDMVNFGSIQTVPKKHRDAGRKLYEWNPATTLMRTSVEENEQMGNIMVEKANAASGPVAFLIPLQGVSILDGDGQPFEDRKADSALFETLKRGLRPDIPLVELDNNINDPEFSETAVKILLQLIEVKSRPGMSARSR